MRSQQGSANPLMNRKWPSRFQRQPPIETARRGLSGQAENSPDWTLVGGTRPASGIDTIEVGLDRVDSPTTACPVRDLDSSGDWRMSIGKVDGSALADTFANYLVGLYPKAIRLKSRLVYDCFALVPVCGQGMLNAGARENVGSTRLRHCAEARQSGGTCR